MWNALNEFESSVISYGSQTATGNGPDNPEFESSVISYGSQTASAVFSFTSSV